MNSSSLSSGELAREFGVSDAVMSEFVARFAPRLVADDAFREDADTMLFVHIPKTAGVSVGKSLQGGFDQFRGVVWNNIAQSFRQETRAAIYLQTREKTRQVIMGHYGWPELQLWRNHEMPLKCGTIFRDPVARAVSNYNYNCSAKHPDHENFLQRFPTLESYIENVSLDFQLTQAIGLISSFENALVKLTRYYTFLGVTEHLSASLAHLARSHGLPNLREYHENVGTKEKAEVPVNVRNKIERRSHNDAKLHRLLMRLYAE